MDAFLSYFLQNGRNGENLFISNAPGPAILIWSDFSEIPKISGITLVRKRNLITELGIDYKLILRILKEKLSNIIPILEVTYNDNLDRFEIDGQDLSNEEASFYLSKIMGIKLGKNPAKKPNNPDQISDPFHIWSREVFDGISVRKVDIDAIQISKDQTYIKSIIEIKRSNKIKIGTWTPFIDPGGTHSDYWNYVMMINLCKILTCNFITIHHEIVNGDLTDETEFEVFIFSINTLISTETISSFGLSRHRRIFKARQLR